MSEKTVVLSAINENEVSKFHERVMQDVAAMAGVACAAIGDRLGLYRAMAVLGDVTPAELANKTGLDERFLRDWLINQAAGGYVKYDTITSKYSLPIAHACVLADENNPLFAAGAFQMFTALSRAVPRIAECFRSGTGMSWGEQDPEVFTGTERLFRPIYVNLLTTNFVEAIPGLKEQLQAGIEVADIGCGHGISTIEMARAFPKSRFYGFDNHVPSIERASQRAQSLGVADRVWFSAANADKIAGSGYGLVMFCNSLHDMGDPIGACRRAGEVLAKNGCIMVVEPMGGNRVDENFNTIGRALSGASVLCCTPNAVATGNHALGAVAPDFELEKIAKAGGLSIFRRVLQTPLNRVFEARK